MSSAKKFIAIFDYLMSTTDKVDVVAIAKLCHNVFSKGEGYSSIVFSPLLDFLVRV